jgi:hypothetical protein
MHYILVHISMPRVIGQGLIEFYAVENFGLKTSIEIHQVVDLTYRTPECVAYVIDDLLD